MERDRNKLDNYIYNKINGYSADLITGNTDDIWALFKEKQRNEKDRKRRILIVILLFALIGTVTSYMHLKSIGGRNENVDKNKVTIYPLSNINVDYNITNYRECDTISESKKEIGKNAYLYAFYSTYLDRVIAYKDNKDVINEHAKDPIPFLKKANILLNRDKNTNTPLKQMSIIKKANISNLVNEGNNDRINPIRKYSIRPNHVRDDVHMIKISLQNVPLCAPTNLKAIEPEVLYYEDVKSNDNQASNTLKASGYFIFNMGVLVYKYDDENLISQTGISPLLGLSYAYDFCERITFEVGALYSVQNGYFKTDTIINEGFFLGRNTSVQLIKIDKVRWIVCPINIGYKIKKRHLIKVGVEIKYLLDTKSKYKEYTTISGIASETMESNITGYKSGLRAFTRSVTVGYEYKISSKLNAFIQIENQLGDLQKKRVITDNWNLNNIYLNAGMKLIIR